ncbi:MFS transporter [Microbacterium sp. SA39]|uniref:MFS transporter n=1 Tax=Microbacterium sp. SA39 TaxID=1263625 RepID=UPI0005F9F929|nr:MFS transporter [Microbacterium sp. SA39]KJQ54437.1 Inner membrane metabolite transport protein YdjE [Microbacterium sp. SA39]
MTIKSVTDTVATINARIDRLPYSGLSKPAFVVIGLAYFFVYYDLSVVGFTLPKISEVFQLTGEQAAVLIATYLAGYMVGDYFISNFGDRRGRRTAMLVTVVVLALGSILSALSWDFTSLLIFRFITGAGTGAEIALATTIVTETSPPHKRGKYLQLMYFWGAAGLTIAPFVSLALIDSEMGWRILLGLGGVVALMLIFMRGRFLPESGRWLAVHGRFDLADREVAKMEAIARAKYGRELPAPQPVPSEHVHGEGDTRRLLKKPYLSRLLVTLLFWTTWLLATNAYLSYGPTIIAEAGGDVGSSMLVTALGYLGTPIGAILAFIFIDRAQRKLLIFTVCVVFAVGLSLIAIGGSQPTVILGTFLSSAMIAANSAAYVYMAEIFPTGLRATAFSIVEGGGNIGSLIMPFVIVALLATVGGTASLWVLAATVLIAGLVILIGGIRTTGKELTKLAQ